MRCPYCGCDDTKVIDSRYADDRQRRRRCCPVCGKRLMLCSECQHGEGSKPCDYDSERDTCHLHQESGRIKRG